MLFDYIIVGAGPAGSVLADRLSSSGTTSVLLIEAGPTDGHPFIHMPKGMGKIIDNPRLTWRFDARWRAGSNQAPTTWVRGKALGGSTAINGMLYVRGQQRDHDDMAALTSADWNWSNIASAYRAVEDYQLGGGEHRGVGGLLHVSLPKSNPLMDDCIAAGQSLGLERTGDLNALRDVPRIGYSPRTIRRGRRQSAAVAFLRTKRPNLRIMTGGVVERVAFDGKCATGVWTRADGILTLYRAKRTILCAGTLNSPAILQRSGVGPAKLLSDLGIPIVTESREVGENLREHLSLRHQWRLRSGRSLNRRLRGWRSIVEGARYYVSRNGPLADASFDVVAAFATRPTEPRANAMMVIAPLSIDDSLPGRTPHRHHGFQAGAYLLRPRSTGRVAIVSADGCRPPEVELDFFADERDRHDMIDVFRFCRAFARQAPIARHIECETSPGAAVESDDEIVDVYRSRGGPGYHASGTCRMGSDAGSVVDPHARVRGVDNLYVMDLSVPPAILSGATQAPVVALAWRFAEMLLGEARS